MSRTSAIAFLLAVVVAAPAFAWSALGHKTVAELAWRQLAPATRQNIVDTIRRHPRFDKDFAAKEDDKSLTGDKATEDHWIFLQASIWPDEIRKVKGVDHPEWHYISLPLYLDPSDERATAGRFKPNLESTFRGKTPSEHLNAIQAFDYCRQTINSDASADVKAVAYCWLIHLVGDIHQPLHCNELVSANQFPKGDEGGNKIPLAKGKNLHSLWDNLLGKQHYLRDVARAADELSHDERFHSPRNVPYSVQSDPMKWAIESHEYCEQQVYSEPILQAIRQSTRDKQMEPVELPPEYYTDAGELARKRIFLAGLRLADVLKPPSGGRKNSQSN